MATFKHASADNYLKKWSEQNESRQTCMLQFGGEDFIIYANVFSPDCNLTYSSSMALAYMPTLDGQSVLDLGTGSGVLAVHAIKKGAASVLAADIDEAALENARENIERHQLSKYIVTQQSNLFKNISGRFDFIIANLPIVDSAWPNSPPVKNLFTRLITDLPTRLNHGGTALLPFASFGNVHVIEELIANSTLHWEKMEQSKLGVTWYLFRATL